MDIKHVEEEAKKVWKKSESQLKNSVFDSKDKEVFSFLEGPPTANASPGLHHLEVRTFKDIINKFKFMQGFSVPRKAGWDCHGLPVEVQVEKKLNLKSKKEVLNYGIEKFIKECKQDVFSNIKEWEESTKELHYLIDLENPYITLDNNYIESVWWSLKKLYEKNLLYEGYKVVPYCPRCGTPLSSHEVSQGYKEVKEDSVYVIFKIKEGEYILAWTTTPWTLPGNVALAVGKDIDYVKAKLPDGDMLILCKDRIDILKGNYEIVEEFKGESLKGISYEPLYDIKELRNGNSYKIILGDFVTTEDGSGVVHTAGMYGEEDYEICKENDLPLVHTVDEEGKFNKLVPEFKGKFVKDADQGIIQDLKKKGRLLKKEKIAHDYPFCWRCDSPLLYYAINSWFVKTTAVKEKMIELNKKINWVPRHIKEGRFGMWLENIKDWNLSRFKFWGTPLPIWRCGCGKEKIIGSVEEMKKESGKEFEDYDLHKPWIDEISFNCECGKEMKRIPDVIDCWYDSGCAPFAQFHYPFENKEEFERRFPYDFIAEAVDQTRGWFYTLHAISTMLFEDICYKNVICAGHVVDENGEKMSKSKGNIIKPREIIDKVGIDAVRLQFCVSSLGNQKRFSEKMVKEDVLPLLNVLYNCHRFYVQASKNKTSVNIEDKWILSRLNSTIKEVTEDLEKYLLDKALEKIMDFAINDFSKTYIKMTRDREDNKEILGKVLKNLSLLIAPYAPYMSEYIYKEFEKSSVHLDSWPKADNTKIDKNLEEEMQIALRMIEKGLAKRDQEKIGLKWPLPFASVSYYKAITEEIGEIIKSQLNIKSLEIMTGSNEEILVELDATLTPELEAEGYAREISRKVQAFRKKLGLEKDEEIELYIFTDDEFKKVLEKNKKFIAQKTNASLFEISFEDKEKFKNKIPFIVKGKKGDLAVVTKR